MSIDEKILNELTQQNIEKDRLLELAYQEIQSAAEYVAAILPKAVSAGDITTDWVYMPSSSVGGDSFGYHWVDEDNFAFYILDICGHGVRSALHSVTILSAINNTSLERTDFRNPAEVLFALNNMFPMKEYGEMFFSMFYCVYNRKNHVLSYAGAGHPPAIIFDAEGSAQSIRSCNRILGFLPGIEFKADSIRLTAPSDIYLFTDGAYEFPTVENRRGEYEDIFRSVQANRGSEPELQNVYLDSLRRNFECPLKDDFTILKISINSL